jgi:calmodulin
LFVSFSIRFSLLDRYLNEGFTLPEAQVLDAFKLFDKQGSGIIDVSLLKPFLLTLGKLTEEEVNEMIAVADPQNSGKIRYYAFVKTLFQ